jgi:hypothetical protein
MRLSHLHHCPSSKYFPRPQAVNKLPESMRCLVHFVLFSTTTRLASNKSSWLKCFVAARVFYLKFVWPICVQNKLHTKLNRIDQINESGYSWGQRQESKSYVLGNHFSIHRLCRSLLLRGGRMRTLLADFCGLALSRRRSAHQSNRSDNDYSSKYESSCEDLSGYRPA